MEKVDFTINAWKSKLLDLTKRNRALNFKPNKVSTVSIVDELAPEIFRLLCLQNKALKFKAAAESTAASKLPDSNYSDTIKPDKIGIFGDLEDTDEDIQSPDFHPYDVSTLASRHTDEYLQTASTVESLDKSLRRLEEQSRLSLEEQGVNSLFLTLGMLQYSDREDASEIYRAPLILVPVELTRKSARTGHTVKKTDDEVIVNPSLSEFLRRTCNVELPELPDSGVIAEGYDLQKFFTATTRAIENQPRWSVKDEIHLGLFSFQKLVIYKDLEKNTINLGAHPIIHKIITRSGDHQVGLPDDVRDMNLDEQFAPEKTQQVVDADSSQLRAIAAVARENNLVLEGPPGTGKSQTITNLIAQTLAVGKSVLFVAEKMAALDVVYRRLVDAGFGEFCLELHSSKANKRAVMHEIGNSLNASLQRPEIAGTSRVRLPDARQALTGYVQAVHSEYGILRQTPYRAVGELAMVLYAPKTVLTNDIFGYSSEQISNAIRDANDLAMISDALEVRPLNHPWRDTHRVFYSEQIIDEIARIASDLTNLLTETQSQARLVESSYGLPPIRKFADIQTASTIASVMAQSPGAPIQVLNNAEWNTPPPDAKALIESGRKVDDLTSQLFQNFAPEVLEYDPRDDIAYVQQKSAGFFSFLAILDGRYRSIRKRWLAYRKPNYQGSLIEQADEMKVAVELLKEKKNFKAKEARGNLLFGALWQGSGSDWNALEKYIAWVSDFRRLFVEHGLRESAVATASRPFPDVGMVKTLEEQSQQIKTLLDRLVSAAEFAPDYFILMDLDKIDARVRELSGNLQMAPRWAQFEDARQKVEKGVIGELLPSAVRQEIAFSELANAFKRAFYQQWLSRVIEERPALRSFHSLSHEERIREFRHLDEGVLRENRSNLVSQLRGHLQASLRRPEIQEGMRFLRGQLTRQKNLAPLRTTIKHSLAAIRAIKPCFMMSPLTVSQLLDDEANKFDLVIFDEASQLPTEEAVCSILRAKQVVVVGDPKQLPPTNFFAVQSGQVNTSLDEYGLPMYEDTQSILEEAMGAGVRQARLKWHYRSAHESLITFSNANFYDSELYTFPSVEIDSTDLGLQFKFVENGVYEGKGLNPIEAREVTDAVIKHFKEMPGLSLGIGTFNVAQQLAIQDEIEKRRRSDPSVEEFFDKNRPEPFFVKNLENIQGDERDVIFLSVTYGRAADGRMRFNLGPLNGENGWRRLNVLTTRARRLMRVFSSIRGSEINLNETASKGAQLLKTFLTYAERRNLDNPLITKPRDYESLFESDVLAELQKRGFDVVRDVGVCGYRIDFGILDGEVPGRYKCGIECDGLSYKSAETARDRDRLRPQVLENQGWDIHRVWSIDWYKDKSGQIDRLSKLIEESKLKALYKNKVPAGSQKAAAGAQPEFSLAESRISNTTTTTAVLEAPDYLRPRAADYTFAPSAQIFSHQGLLAAPVPTVVKAILTVVEAEAPIHIKDLGARVAGMWGQKTGSNITAKIDYILQHLQASNHIVRREDFLWLPNGSFVVRSRKGSGIPAERIAPEEIREAVLMVLRTGSEFTRQELLKEVSGVFGFSRTGATLQQTITVVVEDLLRKGLIGEGRVGIAIRG
jgi:very-short-patch-repair endonuclease